MGRRTPVNVEVEIYNQDLVEKMIKKFSRKVKKCGILEEVRDRRYYEKPSVKRRKQKMNRKRKNRIENEKRKKQETETN